MHKLLRLSAIRLAAFIVLPLMGLSVGTHGAE